MKMMLDTNVVIAVAGRRRQVVEQLRRYDPVEICVSALVMHELYFGAYKGQRAGRNLAEIDAYSFQVLAFDLNDARRAGEIRARLDALGLRIGPYDVLIAGQALARGLTLVTRNTRAFARVEGLSLEDWEG
jgi:tRNA(fMet)-specific endonuclease VapC